MSKTSLSKLFFGIVSLIAVALSLFSFQTYLDHDYFSKSAFEVTGNTIHVRAGGDFQSALERAKPGDTILLEGGATFKGSFNLPVKSGNEFITIRTSSSDEQLPPAGTRLEPDKYVNFLPKLESNVGGSPVILAANGAHHYRFVGIEFLPTIEGLYNIVQIGTTEEKSVAELPHHIEFDRVWIHGSKTHGQRRGIAANGRHIKIHNSYFSDIMRDGEESQAICIWATDGPVEIVNNYLEGAAENILFGGADSYLKLVPTDCLVKDNHLNKPLEWRTQKWDVKNLFEIKNGRRIRVENNLMTNNWTDAQDGTAIQITTRADTGDATIIEDIEFINNIVRSSGSAITVYGSEGQGGHRLQIRNNLFEDIDGRKWNSAGMFLTVTDWDGLIIENNIVLQTGNITNAHGKPVTNFVFRNNIIFENEYGFKGDSEAPGKGSVDKFFPNAQISFNAFIRGKTNYYGEKSVVLDSLEEVKFVDLARRDYHLRPDSPLRSKGLDGASIGANLDFKTVGKAKLVDPMPKRNGSK